MTPWRVSDQSLQSVRCLPGCRIEKDHNHLSYKNRIKELKYVKASELKQNPKNWRRHPETQSKALKGVLDEVGYADAVIARETPDGLMLIDGHLRKEVSPDQELPVLVVDLTENEADIMLATFDPLSALATTDSEKLESLMQDLKCGNSAVQEMISDLAEQEGRIALNTFQEPQEFDEDIPSGHHKCPKCGHEFAV